MSDIKIPSGDLNAEVRNVYKDWEKVMEKWAIEQMNQNGELFVDFRMNYGLLIGSK